ncbi:MAG: DUF1572 family protein [Gemmatimonadota bacterium]
MIEDFRGEYKRYRIIGEKALAQIPDDELNHVHASGGNSAAMIVFHIGGNFASRFTDFLTTDGEKPWRAREEEFAERICSRADLEERWVSGWSVVEAQLASLGDGDFERSVTIRQQPLTVHAALCRSLAHVAYHVGQIVLIARICADRPWQSMSIPRGASDAYNANPILEKVPQ